MLLKGTLSNSITFTVINEYGKGAAVEIESIFRPLTMFPVEGLLKQDFLEISLTTSFGVRNFGHA